MLLSERIQRDKITVEVEPSNEPPLPQAWGNMPTIDYEITLHHGDESMTCPFHTGIGHTEEPGVATILEALLDDAAKIEDTGCFNDWAAENGYGIEDSEKGVREVYEACEEQAADLRRLLGDKYDEYLWETDRG